MRALLFVTVPPLSFLFLTIVVEAGANPASVESATGRSALHKAAFWGHIGTINYLLSTGN